MEPYLKKAVQNVVRRADPDYLLVKTGGAAIGNSSAREFWVSWYNLPGIKK